MIDCRLDATPTDAIYPKINSNPILPPNQSPTFSVDVEIVDLQGRSIRIPTFGAVIHSLTAFPTLISKDLPALPEPTTERTEEMRVESFQKSLSLEPKSFLSEPKSLPLEPKSFLLEQKSPPLEPKSFLLEQKSLPLEKKSFLLEQKSLPPTDASHLRSNVSPFRSDTSHRRSNVSPFRSEPSLPRSNVSSFRSDTSHLRSNASHLRSDVRPLRSNASTPPELILTETHGAVLLPKGGGPGSIGLKMRILVDSLDHLPSPHHLTLFIVGAILMTLGLTTPEPETIPQLSPTPQITQNQQVPAQQLSKHLKQTKSTATDKKKSKSAVHKPWGPTQIPATPPVKPSCPIDDSTRILSRDIKHAILKSSHPI